MTMPNKQNCSHSDNGWCLRCVAELADHRDRLAEVLSAVQCNAIEWSPHVYLLHPQYMAQIDQVLVPVSQKISQEAIDLSKE